MGIDRPMRRKPISPTSRKAVATRPTFTEPIHPRFSLNCRLLARTRGEQGFLSRRSSKVRGLSDGSAARVKLARTGRHLRLSPRGKMSGQFRTGVSLLAETLALRGE